MQKAASDIIIYKASAGAGKTFQLTGEYLKLIFNPQESFKSILAVTFTNKATGEMRERILNELYNLSQGNKSGHAESLKKEYSLNDNELKAKAKNLLNTILHNYGYFNISTIDSFFQIILKSFVREIGLNTGFSVEINFKQVLEMSIQEFLDTIGEKPKISKWLSEFAISRIEENKNWDIQKNIFSFSNDAFSESFFAFSEDRLLKLSQLDVFDEYKTKLKEIQSRFISQINKIGNAGVELLKQNGLTSDQFLQKDKGPGAYFSKLKNAKIGGSFEPNSYVKAAHSSIDGIEGWAGKTSPDRLRIQQCVNGGLQRELQKAFNIFETDFESYLTAIQISKNLDVFAIIVEVYNHLLKYCFEKNFFLLPLAAPLLDKMIQDSDTPFIYEKTGSFLKHIMIDEFQDTSNLQWNNFFPLFINSISQGKKSLVVGDVKQSIYRWRNGNWDLLHSHLKSQFAAFNPSEVNLPYNWRSHKNIVAFNNWVFKNFAEIATGQADTNLNGEKKVTDYHQIINEIYSGVAQQLPPEKEDTVGYISMQFIDQSDKESDFQQKSLDFLISNLVQLFDSGYQPKDIAILVRSNKEGSLVAKTIMNYRVNHPEKGHLFTFVSNDSVFLKSSFIINYLVSAMQYIADPQNQVNKAQLLHFYRMQTIPVSESARKFAEIDLSDKKAFENCLPDEFIQKMDTFRQMPVMEIMNQLLEILIYNLPAFDFAKHAAFIHTFQDVVLKYSKNHGVDVNGFIEWWHESASEMAVSLSEEQNAIRILTIHKSKGLEYKAVMVPFANWKLDQQSKIVWCETLQEPFHHFGLLPLSYSKALNKTVYKDFYIKEYVQAIIDSLNILYVSFTRAEQALFITAPKPKKEEEFKEVGSMLYSLAKSESVASTLGANWDELNLKFELGYLEQRQLTWTNTPEDHWKIIHTNPLVNLKLKLSGDEYLKFDEEKRTQVINKGKIYHQLLENIQVVDDLHKAMEKIVCSGLIAKNESIEFEQKLKQLFANPMIADWFGEKWKVLNEASYLLPDGSVHRPDRVMVSENEAIVVDYKFTTRKLSEHESQVRHYMQSIEALENKRTKGFIWYVLLESIHEVTI